MFPIMFHYIFLIVSRHVANLKRQMKHSWRPEKVGRGGRVVAPDESGGVVGHSNVGPSQIWPPFPVAGTGGLPIQGTEGSVNQSNGE